MLGRLTGLAMLLGVIAMFFGISAASLVRDQINMGGYQLDTITVVNGLQWLVPGPDVRWLAYIAIVMLLLSITGLLIYTGLRLLLKWPPLRWQIIIIFVLLLVAGIIIGVGAIFQYARSSEKQSSSTKRQSILMKSKYIHIASGPNDFHQYFMPLAGDTIPGNKSYALGELGLSIRPVPADTLFITGIQSASAWQETQAAGYARQISHSCTIQDTLVILNPYFMFPMSDGMRYQKLDIIVGIPVKTEVVIDEQLLWRINGSDFVDNDREEGKYIMTSSGLKLQRPAVAESDSLQKSE
jgi:hypothetical protein